MLDHYKILTVTYKQISLKEIGTFRVHADQGVALEVCLAELKEQFHLQELMYTATCNRVMYFLRTERVIDDAFTLEFFQHINPLLSDEVLDTLPNIVVLHEGLGAIKHLLEVAASIDSLVIGERQILGQLRTAFDQCKNWGFIGDSVRLAMNYAIVTAKSIYSDTKIGDKPVSIVSLAIQRLLKANLSKDSRILMIGAGQTNALVAKFLEKHEYTSVTVFNRTLEKASNVAKIVGGSALPLQELQDYKEGFDCIVVCTGAADPILTTSLYEQLLNGETNKKVIIDLAIPHNTTPAVIEQFNVEYIEIEGLRHLAKENMAFREKEVTKAKVLLEKQLEDFPAYYQQRQLEIAMSRIPTEIKEVRKKAVNEVFQKEMATLDDPTKELVEKMLYYMEKKCIGIPMKAAREAIF
ncbi:MAG: glutamyl-tRNA reductase [Bacteroidota bacterium]